MNKDLRKMIKKNFFDRDEKRKRVYVERQNGIGKATI